MDAFRNDRLGVMALLYIAGEADKDQADWNIADKPNLLSVYNGLHIFHSTKYYKHHSCYEVVSKWKLQGFVGWNKHPNAMIIFFDFHTMQT